MSLLRRHAVPIVPPSPGLPLIKNTCSLGKHLMWRKGRSTIDEDAPEEVKKKHVLRDAQIFIEWMWKEDRAEFKGRMKVSGPFPHFEAKPPDVQVGDRGGTRLRARSIITDTAPSGKEDYIIEALFAVPEYVSEIPTDLAMELFGRPGGRPGLRPLREREWRGITHGN